VVLTAPDTGERVDDKPDEIVVVPMVEAAPGLSRRERERKRRRRFRRRAVLLVFLGLLAVPGWSLGRVLLANNTDPLGVRVVEWARDHHLGGLVDRVENYWYTHHPPPRGGTPKGGIPRVAAAAAPATIVTTEPTAPPIAAKPVVAAKPAVRARKPQPAPRKPSVAVWPPTPRQP